MGLICRMMSWKCCGRTYVLRRNYDDHLQKAHGIIEPIKQPTLVGRAVRGALHNADVILSISLMIAIGWTIFEAIA